MRINQKVSTEANKNHRNNPENQIPSRTNPCTTCHDRGGSTLNSQNTDISLEWEICNSCLLGHMSSELCTTWWHPMIFLEAFIVFQHSLPERFHLIRRWCSSSSGWLEKSSWCAQGGAAKPSSPWMERERLCEERGAKGTIRAAKPGGKVWMSFYTTFLGVLLLNLMPRKRIKLDVVQWENYLSMAVWERHGSHAVHSRILKNPSSKKV